MKVLKKLLSYGVVLGLAVSLVGCSGKSTDNQEANKLEEIKKNSKIVIGTSADFPPFEFHKMVDGEDKIVGFDDLLAQEIAKEIRVEVEYKEIDFDGLIGALNADKVDVVLAGMSPTEEREKSVDFSDLYYISKNAVIVRDGDEDKIKTEDDLKKLKVGVQKGSIQENYVINTLGLDNAKSLTATPDLILELKNKNIDAIVSNESVCMINVKQYDGIKMSKSSIGEDLEEGMAVAIKKGENNKELIDLINKKIKELKDSGKMKEFLEEATTQAASK